MHPSVRKSYLIASYLYWATVGLFLLPALYALLKPLTGHHNSDPYGLTGIVVFTCLLLLGFSAALGFGLKAGKTWAKVVYVLYTGWLLHYCFRDLTSYLHQDVQVIGYSLLCWALQLSIGFFLFRHHFAHDSPATGAQEPVV